MDQTQPHTSWARAPLLSFPHPILDYAHDHYYNNPAGQENTETQVTYQRYLDHKSPDVVAEELGVKGPREESKRIPPGNRDVPLLAPTHVLESLSPFISSVSAILSM